MKDGDEAIRALVAFILTSALLGLGYLIAEASIVFGLIPTLTILGTFAVVWWGAYQIVGK